MTLKVYHLLSLSFTFTVISCIRGVTDNWIYVQQLTAHVESYDYMIHLKQPFEFILFYGHIFDLSVRSVGDKLLEQGICIKFFSEIGDQCNWHLHSITVEHRLSYCTA